MTSFLTHDSGIAAGLTANFAQKNSGGSFPARPSRMLPGAFLRGQSLLGPLRQLMRRIDMSMSGVMPILREQPRTSLFMG
jgi:hypothetical protein